MKNMDLDGFLDDPLELFTKKRTGTEIIHMLSLHVNKNKSKGIKR